MYCKIITQKTKNITHKKRGLLILLFTAKEFLQAREKQKRRDSRNES